MKQIQIDMFEVQLGAALLIQMRDSLNAPVRVIADAGIQVRQHYPRDHVAKKLPAVLRSFGGGDDKRIDLLVGTHYDEDHIRGLTDVAQAFDITEAILPPVCAPPPAIGTDAITAASKQMSAVGSNGVVDGPLLSFDDNWHDHCVAYRDYQRAVYKAAKSRLQHVTQRLAELLEWQRLSRPSIDTPELLVRLLNEDAGIGEAIELLTAAYLADWDLIGRPSNHQAASAGSYLDLNASVGVLLTAVLQIALIRRAAAKGAITAKWLDELVVALSAKSVPMRYEKIQRGVPKYFIWNPMTRRFEHTLKADEFRDSDEPKFALLGPSSYLVSHFRSTIPVGVYLTIGGHILRKPITASNQLSYVMVFEADGQAMLICGDAGCVDFDNPATKAYYPALLNALKTPKVAQIAHHAGANSEFYHVLLESNFAQGNVDPYLLLSHAYHDAKRPSYEFGQFADELTNNGYSFRLLFTSDPVKAKVASYQNKIHAVCPAGNNRNQGDVRLTYSGNSWTVDSHSIQP